LTALLQSPDEYQTLSGMRVADGVREFLLSASPDFFVQLQNANAPDPWKFGFAIIREINNRAGGSRATRMGKPARVEEPGGESINVVIGICGFTAPPDSDGVAEIGYSIAPSYQGKGYATEAAQALITFASRDHRVRIICAHTLAQINASTRVLEKCGFKKTSEIVDSENNLVWRWEKPVSSRPE